jgi:hypothetical protein
MGYIIGFFLIAGAIFLAGALVGRISAPDRGPRKAELARAKEALAKLDDIVAGGSLELRMLGSDIGEKAMTVLRTYWKGSN